MEGDLSSDASVHSTNTLDHLLFARYCLGIGDIAANKNPCPHGDYILVKEVTKSKIEK